MSGALRVQVWTMPVGGLSETDTSPWRDILDATEQARAARFVFDRDRTTYIAAHALVRVALTSMHAGATPRDWRFVEGEHGKPTAWVGNRAAPLSFNLSHTHGMVGLAAVASPGCALGFDVESLDRKVTLAVADRYFCPEEIAWLGQLSEPERPHGFLRLWTLKEAFIKATGQGLAQDLASFWFKPLLPQIHFKPKLAERTEDWRFEQRILANGHFIAAVGIRHQGMAGRTSHQAVETACVETHWTEVHPSEFRVDSTGFATNPPCR
jgi:4'-phosphopantetheinyl transferase